MTTEYTFTVTQTVRVAAESLEAARDAVLNGGDVNIVQLDIEPESGVNKPLLDAILDRGPWEQMLALGYERLIDDELADAIDWECNSCRPDVGWVKWATARRDTSSPTMHIEVECGHCLGSQIYDGDGYELEVN